MAEEGNKGIRDAIKLLLANVSTKFEDAEGREDGQQRLDLRALKDLLGVVGSWAGKGKDEVVQVLCREIGLAIAAMIKEPVTQILENRKLQITLEFTPKNGHKPSAKAQTKKQQSGRFSAKPREKRTRS